MLIVHGSTLTNLPSGNQGKLGFLVPGDSVPVGCTSSMAAILGQIPCSPSVGMHV